MYYPDNMNLAAITETDDDRAAKEAQEELFNFRQAVLELGAEFADKLRKQTGVAVDRDELFENLFEVHEIWKEVNRLELKAL